MSKAVYFVPVMIFLTLVCWAMASPIGSSPDDDFHLSSIWCANGDAEGACQLYQDGELAVVPSIVKRASECYRHLPHQSAVCQRAYPQVTDGLDTLTRHFNKGLYPSFYFKVMNNLVGENVLYASFAMRLVNIFLFILLAATIFYFGDHKLRVSFTWLWLVCSVPMGFFLIASNNPSAWTNIGIGGLFGALLGYFHSQDRTKIIFAVLVIICCVIAFGSRADAAIYAVLTLMATAILAKRNWPTLKDFDTYFLIALSVVAIVVFFSAGQGQVAMGNGLGVIGSGRDVASVLWHNFTLLPELWFGGLGVQPLGWLDTVMPSTVYIAGCAAFFIVVAANINNMWRGKKIAISLLLLAITVIPLWVLMKSLNLIPENVQARYILPLVYVLMGVMTFQRQGDPVYFNRVTRLTIIIALSVSHALALHVNIRRYVTGLDIVGWNLNYNAEWWGWPQITPMAVWGIASLSFLMLSYVLVEFISTQPRPLTGKR